MQPLSREQLNRNRYLRATSFEGKSELGDSLRIAVGDDYSAHKRNRDMAPSKHDDNAGEIITTTATSSPITVIEYPSSATGAPPSPRMLSAELGTDECHSTSSSSSSSSPPTHPAFFAPSAAAATDKPPGNRVAVQGKENVCPSPMAASFSPLGSPLAVLTTRKASVAQKGAIAVMLKRFIDEGPVDAGEELAEKAKTVLGNVDTNVLAAMPSERADGASEVDTSSNKKKKKSKKTNGHSNGHSNEHSSEQLPPEPASYAEAIKENPVIAKKREAEAAENTDEKDKSGGQAKGSTTANEEEKDASPTPAGDLTFAQAVKEDPDDVERRSKRAIRSKEVDSGGKTTPPISQASTSVDYPDIQSDADDEAEPQRRRDKEKAAEVFGTRWAPLKVPVKRRLQTAAVLVHSVAIGLSLSVFFSWCAVPFFWPIIIIYLVSMLFATDATDGRLRKRKEWIRRLPIWTYFGEYFPARLHKTHDLQPTRKYILGYHPHGIISHGAWAAFATEALGFADKFPGITNSLCTLDSNFNLPLYREYVFSMGLSSVSRESIKNLLTHGGPNNEGMGRAVTIVVGGARESLEAQPNTMRLIINERKGFIKIALQTGADLVPVLAFGENDLYDQLDPHKHPWLHGLQRYFLKAWKFTVPMLHGRGIFNYDVGLMPYRRPINIVVGKPIPVAQSANPDNSEVNRLHDLYTEELQRIWERYKDDFATHRREELQFLD